MRYVVAELVAVAPFDFGRLISISDMSNSIEDATCHVDHGSPGGSRLGVSRELAEQLHAHTNHHPERGHE